MTEPCVIIREIVFDIHNIISYTIILVLSIHSARFSN